MTENWIDLLIIYFTIITISNKKKGGPYYHISIVKKFLQKPFRWNVSPATKKFNEFQGMLKKNWTYIRRGKKMLHKFKKKKNNCSGFWLDLCQK